MIPNPGKTFVERAKEYSEDMRWLASNTVVFGDLLEDDFDWGRDKWAYIDKEMRDRINKKIEAHYRYRDIQGTPARFSQQLVARLNECIEWIGPQYAIIAAGIENAKVGESSKNKDRRVHSEFPASQLAGHNDYADTADDYQREDTANIGDLEAAAGALNLIRNLDMQIVEYVGPAFSMIISPRVAWNG